MSISPVSRVQSLTCILPQYYSLVSKTTVVDVMTGRHAAGISGIFGVVASSSQSFKMAEIGRSKGESEGL